MGLNIIVLNAAISMLDYMKKPSAENRRCNIDLPTRYDTIKFDEFILSPVGATTFKPDLYKFLNVKFVAEKYVVNGVERWEWALEGWS